MKAKLTLALVLMSLLFPSSFCQGKPKAFGTQKLFYFDGKFKDKQPYGYGILELYNPREWQKQDLIITTVYRPKKVYQLITGTFDHGKVSDASLYIGNNLIFQGELTFNLKEESGSWTSILSLQQGILTINNQEIEITKPYELTFVSDKQRDALTGYTSGYVVYDGYRSVGDLQHSGYSWAKYLNIPSTATLMTKTRETLTGLSIQKDGGVYWKYRDVFGKEGTFQYTNYTVHYENGDYYCVGGNFKKTLDSCVVLYDSRTNIDDFCDEIRRYLNNKFLQQDVNNNLNALHEELLANHNNIKWKYAHNTYHSGVIYSIQYPNGDIFVGCCNTAEPGHWDEIYSIHTTPAQADYWYGKLIKKNRDTLFFIYGKNADESINAALKGYCQKKAAQQKKAAEEEQARQKIYLADCNKYGKKYVDAATNHQILIGMPESLFLKYFSEPWFEDKITAGVQCSLERAYTSGNITKYRLYVHAYTYGWNSAEGKDYLLITFRNGKLDSYVR